MCGICGYINLNQTSQINDNTIVKMANRMEHRGPDDIGHYSENSFSLAMRRLSIIDTENGNQPIYSDDKKIVIIMNGELYNYKQLRDELMTKNIKFKTNSDTEVVLKMYELYGLTCIDKLQGMFAFCINDSKLNITWLVRDRFGIKPLLYYYDSEKLIFGSTIDSMLASKQIDTSLDETSIRLYLLISYIPTPHTIYKNIKKLQPGHQIIIRDKSVAISKYWEIEDHIDSKKNLKSEDDFIDLLNKSIDIHSVSDVPVGTFLSGGIDSSVITKLYKKISRDDFNTFSAEFDGKDNADSKTANLISDKLKTTHHNIKITSDEFLPNLDELINYLDEPLYDSSMVASYLLSKTAQKNKIKVLLAGNGADEIFGGYHRHYSTIKSLTAGKLKIFSDRFLKNLSWILPNSYHKLVQLKYEHISHAITFSGINLETYRNVVKNSDFDSINNLLNNYFNVNHDKDLSYSKKMMIKDLRTYLLDNGLNILDKTTMAASIEGRVPYLDHKLVEHLFSMHEKSYLSNNYHDSKPMLKRYANRIDLNEVTKRKKSGFNQPLEKIFSSSKNIKKIKETLIESNKYLSKFIDIEEVISIIDNNKNNKSLENIMNIYVLAKWFNKKHIQQ